MQYKNAVQNRRFDHQEVFVLLKGIIRTGQSKCKGTSEWP